MDKKVVFKPYCQDQQFLLPKNTDDFVIKGHIARLISKIIDGMDLSFVVETYKGGGASSYNPKMLLKVWILGFVYRIYTCRLLAKAIRENLPFIWVTGNQQPDFRTLNNFRLRLKDEIKEIFKEIVKYGLEKGIIDGKDIFVDHTKNEANSNKYKVVWKKNVERQLNNIDKELDELFKHIDIMNEDEENLFSGKDFPEQERTGFSDEKVKEIISDINQKIKEKTLNKKQGQEKKDKIRRTKQLLERKIKYEKQKEILGKRNSFSRTDNDAVAMMMKDKITIRPAYNEGISVENGFVIDYVVSDSSSDVVSFIPLMDGTINNLGKIPENTHGDAGYGSEETMTYLEKKKIKNYLKYNTFQKEKNQKWREKNLRTEDLKYNEEKDEFVCKKGIKLKFQKINEEITKTGYKKKLKVYKTEKGKCKCSFHKHNSETLSISWKYEQLRKQAKENLNTEKGIELRKRRGNEIESIFGDKKLNKKNRRYNLRGIKKVNIEAGLHYITHNIQKIHTKINSQTKKYPQF